MQVLETAGSLYKLWCKFETVWLQILRRIAHQFQSVLPLILAHVVKYVPVLQPRADDAQREHRL